jgi:hypothetical protein
MFVRTILTTFEPVKDLLIVREQEIARLLLTYEDQQTAGQEPQRLLLEQAKELLEQKLKVFPLDDELVRLAQVIYCGLGEHLAEVAVLRRYLETSLDVNVRAWAWWHLVDCLALARCVPETVSEQQMFLQWALATFPADQCFFVIADGTQARAWQRAGVSQEWFQQCHRLFQQALWTPENRLDRFYCLRTYAHLALTLHAFEEVHQSFQMLHNLLDEDHACQERWWLSVEVSMLELGEAQARDDIPYMRTIAQTMTHELTAWEQKYLHEEDGTRGTVERFRSLCHNTAAPLYRAKLYDVAIPLFAKAVAYHTIPYQSYLWLAGSLWHTTHEKERVFALLQQAATRFDNVGDPWSTFQLLPEFSDASFWHELRTTI